jgi:cytoskeletal protein RodZ
MILPVTVEDITDQIGERLTKAREKADLTVDDVIFKTRIPRAVILALEAAEFSFFSSPTYAKSFLAQYSGFLNVDADIWLDALQPASFISGEFVCPIWEPAGPKKEETPQQREPASGWFSAVSLLAITCGVVFAAIKGYEFFDTRFGTELNPNPAITEAPDLQQAKPAPSNPAPPPPPYGEGKPIVQQTENDAVQPPPRAIIVR